MKNGMRTSFDGREVIVLGEPLPRLRRKCALVVMVWIFLLIERIKLKRFQGAGKYPLHLLQLTKFLDGGLLPAFDYFCFHFHNAYAKRLIFSSTKSLIQWLWKLRVQSSKPVMPCSFSSIRT